VISLPIEIVLIGGLVMTLLLSYLLLRRVGEFSWGIYGVIAAVVFFFGSELLGASLLDALGSGLQRFLGLGLILVAVLGYQYLRSRSGPDEVNRIEIGGGGD